MNNNIIDSVNVDGVKYQIKDEKAVEHLTLEDYTSGIEYENLLYKLIKGKYNGVYILNNRYIAKCVRNTETIYTAYLEPIGENDYELGGRGWKTTADADQITLDTLEVKEYGNMGGSSKLYKHDIDLGITFTESGTSFGETISIYSTNSQMTQESFFEYLYNELTKKKNTSNKVSFYGIKDSISKLTITNNYYGGLNIGITLKVVQFTTTGMNAATEYYNLATGNMTSWEQVLENVTISSIKTTEL